MIAIREQAERDLREMKQAEQQELFTTWTTEHTGTDTILIGTVEVPIAEAREIERIAEAVGISMQKAMEVRLLVLSGIRTVEAQPRSIGLEEQCDQMRQKCVKAAFRLARMALVWKNNAIRCGKSASRPLFVLRECST